MRHVPQRTCVGCRTVRDRRELVRVVRTPDGRFLLDPAGKMAGRGAYLCPRTVCLEQAVKRKGFDRAFRQAVPRDAVAALESSLNEYVRAATGRSVEEPAGGPGPEAGRAAGEGGG